MDEDRSKRGSLAVRRLCAEVRNAEAAIHGFAQLARDGTLTPAEALASIVEASQILSRVRDEVEVSEGLACTDPRAHDSARLRDHARLQAAGLRDAAKPRDDR